MPDQAQDPLELEKFALERSKLRTERQKLAIDLLLKRRELAASGTKSWKELLANPLTLAIAGGVLTVLTTLATSTFTAHQAAQSAKQALQAELIKKFVEAPQTETVRENLRFLVDAGLLPDYAAGITDYLKNNPNAAPTVTSLVGGVVGSQDQRVLLSDVAAATRTRFQGVGIIRAGQSICTGVMIAPTIVATASHCISAHSPMSQSIAPAVTFQSAPIGADKNQPAPVEIDVARMMVVGTPTPDTSTVILAPLKTTDVSLPYLVLDDTMPPVSARLEATFFAGDRGNWVYSSGTGCRVIAVEPSTLRHLCDTGGGSSGAPLLGPSGRVVAVHTGLGPESKKAFRADVIRQDPAVLARFGELPTTAANSSKP